RALVLLRRRWPEPTRERNDEQNDADDREPRDPKHETVEDRQHLGRDAERIQRVLRHALDNGILGRERRGRQRIASAIENGTLEDNGALRRRKIGALPQWIAAPNRRNHREVVRRRRRIHRPLERGAVPWIRARLDPP